MDEGLGFRGKKGAHVDLSADIQRRKRDLPRFAPSVRCKDLLLLCLILIDDGDYKVVMMAMVVFDLEREILITSPTTPPSLCKGG
jgi:hypothetical protein